MILQPRDMLLLEGLKKYGVLSTPQIVQLCFQSIAKTTALRRLRLLEKGNYIRRPVPLDDGTSTWTLGLKGKQLLAVEESMQFSNRNTIYHDVLVNSLRMKLESIGLGQDWTPEYQLKAHAFKNYQYRHAKERLIPDGILVEPYEGNPLKIAIEVELTRKSEARYKYVFGEYRDLAFDQVWYFVNDLRDREKITEIAGRTFGFNPHVLMFSVIPEFLKEPVPHVFLHGNKAPTQISSIRFDRLKIQAPAQSLDQGVSRLDTGKLELVEVAMSSDLQPNSHIPASLRDGPQTPDPSHSTIERGQEFGDRDGMWEFRVSDEYKDCG